MIKKDDERKEEREREVPGGRKVKGEKERKKMER